MGNTGAVKIMKYYQQLKKAFFITASSIALISCTELSEKSESSFSLSNTGNPVEREVTPEPNSAPTANISGGTTVNTGSQISILANGADADGDALTFTWVLTTPANSSTQLASTNTANASFIPDIDGQYTLTVTISDGVDSQTASHTITASTPIEGTPNSSNITVALVSDSGNDGHGPENTLDNNLNSSSRWSSESPGATESWINYELSESISISSLSIAFYRGNLRTTNFRIELSSDGTNWAEVFNGSSSGNAVTLENFTFAETATQHIRIFGSGNSENDWNSITEVSIPGVTKTSSTPTNTAPVAGISGNNNVNTGSQISLLSNSNDDDGDNLSFNWTLTGPEGSTAQLASNTTANASFVPDIDGEYSLTLTVNDGKVDSLPVNQTVLAFTPVPDVNDAPVPNFTMVNQAQINTEVTIDASSSTDDEDDPITYRLRLDTPNGSTATLSATETTSPLITFTPDVEGDYTVSLIASDGNQDSDEISRTLTAVTEVVETPTNGAPIPVITASSRVDSGSNVSVNALNSSDPENDTLTYLWSLDTPASSVAALSSTTNAETSFFADRDGTYVVNLTVNDGNNSQTTSHTITAGTTNVGEFVRQGDCAGETAALIARDDIVMCEGWESDDWWGTEDGTVNKGWYRHPTTKSPPLRTLAGGQNYAGVSNTSIETDPSKCIAGNCLKINVRQYKVTHINEHWLLKHATKPGSSEFKPDELFLRYYIKFSETWDGQYNCKSDGTRVQGGGKFPGFADTRVNNSNTGEIQCGNGGSRSDGINCWSVRQGWTTCANRPNDSLSGSNNRVCDTVPGAKGRWMHYVYHPNQAGQTGDPGIWDDNQWRSFGQYWSNPCREPWNMYCGNLTPNDDAKSTASTPPGTLDPALKVDNKGVIVSNEWIAIEIQVKMNTPGQADGILRGWKNGELAYEKTNMEYRKIGHDDLHLRSFWMDHYNGGVDGPCESATIWMDQLVISTSQRPGLIPSNP